MHGPRCCRVRNGLRSEADGTHGSDMVDRTCCVVSLSSSSSAARRPTRGVTEDGKSGSHTGTQDAGKDHVRQCAATAQHRRARRRGRPGRTDRCELPPDMPMLQIEGGKAAAALQFQVEDADRRGAGRDLPRRGRLVRTHRRQRLVHAFRYARRHHLHRSARRQQGAAHAAHDRARLGAKRREPTIPMRHDASGGYGGVGGEGPGGTLGDDVQKALDAQAQADSALQWLYPYDEHGVSARLARAAADVVGRAARRRRRHRAAPVRRPLRLSRLLRPPARARRRRGVRAPSDPASGVGSRDQHGRRRQLDGRAHARQGGNAYGPITRAPGRSPTAGSRARSTTRATAPTSQRTSTGAMGGDGKFGGATLAIKPGALGPELVAGANGGEQQCRVCHSVSSHGSRMTVQHGDDYAATSSYDLRNGYTETAYPPATQQPARVDRHDARTARSDSPTANRWTSTAIRSRSSTTCRRARSCRERADGVRARGGVPGVRARRQGVAFNFWNGPGNATIGAGDGKKLVAMDFDPMTNVFGNPQLLYQGDLRPGWPSFSPTANSLVYRARSSTRGRDRSCSTRATAARASCGGPTCARAKPIASTPPTAWRRQVVSADEHREPRRRRSAELRADDRADRVRRFRMDGVHQPAPVRQRGDDRSVVQRSARARSDLDADDEEAVGRCDRPRRANGRVHRARGDDPSHPAFYLPGQELLAGNTRGFWVVDPCKEDGKTCESGVECCTGYCQEEDNGKLTCGRKTDDCVQEFDHCDTRADCCDDTAECVNHVCTMISVD